MILNVGGFNNICKNLIKKQNFTNDARAKGDCIIQSNIRMTPQVETSQEKQSRGNILIILSGKLNLEKEKQDKVSISHINC